MHTAYLALGANLGDRLAAMCGAVQRLGSHPALRFDASADVSSLYETSPIGGPAGQAMFLNSALRLRTELDAFELLRVLLAVETSLGRIRGTPWGPRVIDLDLLFFDDAVIDSTELIVPHPRLDERRFVLEPLCEIASDVMHPVWGMTVTALAHRLRAAECVDNVVRVAGPQWALPDGVAIRR